MNETNKERCQRIIDDTPWMDCEFGDEGDRPGRYFEVKDRDFDFLIVEAQRAEELEKENKNLNNIIFAYERALEIKTGKPAVQILTELTDGMKKSLEGLQMVQAHDVKE